MMTMGIKRMAVLAIAKSLRDCRLSKENKRVAALAVHQALLEIEPRYDFRRFLSIAAEEKFEDNKDDS